MEGSSRNNTATNTKVTVRQITKETAAAVEKQKKKK